MFIKCRRIISKLESNCECIEKKLRKKRKVPNKNCLQLTFNSCCSKAVGKMYLLLLWLLLFLLLLFCTPDTNTRAHTRTREYTYVNTHEHNTSTKKIHKPVPEAAAATICCYFTCCCFCCCTCCSCCCCGNSFWKCVTICKRFSWVLLVGICALTLKRSNGNGEAKVQMPQNDQQNTPRRTKRGKRLILIDSVPLWKTANELKNTYIQSERKRNEMKRGPSNEPTQWHDKHTKWNSQQQQWQRSGWSSAWEQHEREKLKISCMQIL